MYKILIVDDEVLVRVGFKTYIPWEEYGFVIAGEAENGREALEKCSRLDPDIIFTDIKMPYIDGIQLLEIIKKNYPHIKSVVLSCYDDFSLVKQAMKLGASDYILKPTMEQNDIVNILNNLKNELDEQKFKKNEENTAKTMTAVLNDKQLEDMLRDLIIRNDSSVLAAVSSRLTGFDMGNAYNCVCLCHIDNYNNLLKQIILDREQFRVSIKGIINSTTRSNIFLFNTFHPYEYGMLINFDASNAGYVEKSIHMTVEKLQSNIKNYMNCSVTFALSKTERGKNNLNKLFKQAEEMLKLKFYHNPGSIISYCDYANRKSNSCKAPIKFDSELILKYIEDNDSKLLFGYLDQVFSGLFSGMFQDIEEVRKICIQLLFLFEMQFSSYAEIKELFEASNYYEFIKNEDFLVSVKAYIYTLLEKFLDILNSNRNNFDNIIRKAIEYIEKHYMEDITLKSISDYVGLSRTYFCNFFKQQTKKNFTNYICEVRMKKAKKLLANPQMKIYEVSKAVGIDNARHFCNIFKRYYGVTPMEFKKHSPMTED